MSSEVNKKSTKAPNSAGIVAAMMMMKRSVWVLLIMFMVAVLFAAAATMVEERPHSGMGGVQSLRAEKRLSMRRSEEAAMLLESDSGASASSVGNNVLQSLQQHQDRQDDPRLDDIVERMLIHNGDISLSAPPNKAIEVTAQIEAMVKVDGGYLENQSSRREHFWRGGERNEERLVVDLTVRIPSAKFHDFVSKLQKMAGTRVRDISTHSQDVTESFMDATSRAETLRASQAALQLLLAKAGTIQEVLEVQRELNRLTQEYESQKARANSLQKQSNMSTLRIHLVEQQNGSDGGSLDGIGAVFFAAMSPLVTFRHALRDVVMVFAVVVNILVYASVIVMALALPGYLLYCLCWHKAAKSATNHHHSSNGTALILPK